MVREFSAESHLTSGFGKTRSIQPLGALFTKLMKKSEAKKLIELQACITYLLDEFLLEVERLSDHDEKTSLKRSTTQAIGTCVADIMIPIFTQYPSLDYIGSKENTLITTWISLARKRRFEEAAFSSSRGV